MDARRFAGVRSLLALKPPSLPSSSSSAVQVQGRPMAYIPPFKPERRSMRPSFRGWDEEDEEETAKRTPEPFKDPYAQSTFNKTSMFGENRFNATRGVPTGPRADRSLASSSSYPKDESSWSSNRAFDRSKPSRSSRNDFDHVSLKDNGREASQRLNRRDEGRLNVHEPPRFPRSMLNEDTRKMYRSNKLGVSPKSKHNPLNDHLSFDFDSSSGSKSHLPLSQEVPVDNNGPPVFDSPFNYASVPSRAFKSVQGASAETTGPSDEYLTQATVPSHALPESEAPRKLLILDLNGTLVVRSAKNQIYPRPYMPSLRDYIFDKRTQEWLDTMVWSSAASKNVERMVYRCFLNEELLGAVMGDPVNEVLRDRGKGRGKDVSMPENWGLWRGKLLDVWARDTLGLTEEQFYRKSATTKDLNNIWFSLNNIAKGIASDPKKAQQRRSRSTHGPATTFLLDDSPYKVRLQPFNHICLLEYDMDLRAHDLGVLDAEQCKNGTVYDDRYLPSAGSYRRSAFTAIPPPGPANRKTPMENQGKPLTNGFAWKPAGLIFNRRPQQTESRFSSIIKTGFGTYRHQSPDFDVEEGIPESSESSDETISPSLLNATYDETLLAVIGVIESLRPQSNVAGWIKEGGLWAGKDAPTVSVQASDAAFSNRGEDGRRSPTDFEVEELLMERRQKEGAMKTKVERGQKKVVLPGNDAFALPFTSGSKSSASPKKPTFKLPELPTSSLKDAITGHNVHHTRTPHASQSTYISRTHSTKTATNATIEASSKKPNSLRPKMSTTYRPNSVVHAKPTIPMWFDDEETFRTWVTRGREALKRMGIPERHGVL